MRPNGSKFTEGDLFIISSNFNPIFEDPMESIEERRERKKNSVFGNGLKLA